MSVAFYLSTIPNARLLTMQAFAASRILSRMVHTHSRAATVTSLSHRQLSTSHATFGTKVHNLFVYFFLRKEKKILFLFLLFCATWFCHISFSLLL